MPHPKLSDSQINGLIEQVAQYIEWQRQTYRAKATGIDWNHKTAMKQFFAPSILESARVNVLKNERVANPPFYPALVQIGFGPALLPDFSLMAAITFVDTIVSHGPMSMQTLFHELVHAVQYEKLGLPEFAAKYVYGFLRGGSYEAIPLEQNAYQLDERFARAPQVQFSVEDEVQQWIDSKSF